MSQQNSGWDLHLLYWSSPKHAVGYCDISISIYMLGMAYDKALI